MAYRTLKKEFHARNAAAAEELYQARFNSESALRWDFPVGDHQLFCLVSPEVLNLVEQIYHHELRVQRSWSRLPLGVRNHYIRSLLLDEVVSTNAIEGVPSTRRQIDEALDAASNTTDHRRFREMSRLYLAFAEENAELPDTPSELRELYDALMDGEIEPGDRLDGELFRKDTVTILDSRQKEVHQGFHPEEKIIQGLETMIQAIKNDTAPSVVTAVITHFMFESIHPFYDGNGRTGRYLLGLQLSQLLSTPTALTLSRTLNEEKRSYYKAFQEVESPLNKGDGTPFTLALLSLIAKAQQALHEDIEMRLGMLISLGQVIEEIRNNTESGLKPKAIDLLYLLGQVWLFGSGGTIKLEGVAEFLDSSPDTARRHLLDLESAELVETTSRRPLRFILSKLGAEKLGLQDI